MTPAERYARCEPIEVQLEGGYVDSPKDPGGPTNMGVTLAALAQHRGHPVTAADVRALTPAEVRQIYAETYWPDVHGDELPAGVDLIVFDCGVNCGRGAAIRILQGALGVVADGQFGDITRTALAATVDRVGLVERIRQRRSAYYAGLKGYPTFGAGWDRRLHTVALTATAWAARP